MKGKVTLGSLRVRQDYLIAEGLLAPYDDEEKPDIPMQMALARIRQLSAHEVGHTLGIQHNMAASTQGRTSVMDYPHPLIQFDDSGNINLDEAYAVGIGEWDKRVIHYGYTDFPDDADAEAGRDQIMADTIDSGLVYVSDGDSRAISSAHPLGNLWDNGADSIVIFIDDGICSNAECQIANVDYHVSVALWIVDDCPRARIGAEKFIQCNFS